MAFGDQFRDWPLVQSTSNQQDDVINHVAVSNEVQERRQWLDRMIPEVLELNDKLFAQLVVDGRDGERTRLIGKEGTIVGTLQVKL